ncbi:hypothetical protein [Kitasatospora sp. NPDC091207]|uniref:hypothetical protein n=1 Tax=Kitasatospora sp. NPDC091207 TaxID=3364083 RepID=UPI0037FE4173
MNPHLPLPALTSHEALLVALIVAGTDHGRIGADPEAGLFGADVGAAIAALLVKTGCRTVQQLAAWSGAPSDRHRHRRALRRARGAAPAHQAPAADPRRLAVGRSIPELTADFGIAPTTMRTYIKTLLSQLGVGSQVQASLVGVLSGLTVLSAIDPSWPAEPLRRAAASNPLAA